MASLEFAGRTTTDCGLPYFFTGDDPCATRVDIMEGVLSFLRWEFLDDFPEFFYLSIFYFCVTNETSNDNDLI